MARTTGSAGLRCSTLPGTTLLSRPCGDGSGRYEVRYGADSVFTRSTKPFPLRQAHESPKASAKASNFKKPFSVCCAGKSPDDFSQTERGEENEENEFVAPRVTPDYVGENSIKPPPRIEKNLEGPWITRWGGNVRGGKYQMGQGTDRIIEIFANGDAMLIAAGGIAILFIVLLQFRPPPPP